MSGVKVFLEFFKIVSVALREPAKCRFCQRIDLQPSFSSIVLKALLLLILELLAGELWEKRLYKSFEIVTASSSSLNFEMLEEVREALLLCTWSFYV